MKKRYALVNFDTAEVYTIEGENISPQYLYKRAEHIRREAVHYGWRLDKMQLVRLDEAKSIYDGALIAEWEGGMNTPIEDLRLCVRAYYTLKNRRCDNVGQICEYVKSDDIFRRMPSKVIQQVITAILPYDRATAQALTRKLNIRVRKMASLSK